MIESAAPVLGAHTPTDQRATAAVTEEVRVTEAFRSGGYLMETPSIVVSLTTEGQMVDATAEEGDLNIAAESCETIIDSAFTSFEHQAVEEATEENKQVTIGFADNNPLQIRAAEVEAEERSICEFNSSEYMTSEECKPESITIESASTLFGVHIPTQNRTNEATMEDEIYVGTSAASASFIEGATSTVDHIPTDSQVLETTTEEYDSIYTPRSCKSISPAVPALGIHIPASNRAVDAASEHGKPIGEYVVEPAHGGYCFAANEGNGTGGVYLYLFNSAFPLLFNEFSVFNTINITKMFIYFKS